MHILPYEFLKFKIINYLQREHHSIKLNKIKKLYFYVEDILYAFFLAV